MKTKDFGFLFLLVTWNAIGLTQVDPKRVLDHIKRVGGGQAILNYYDKDQWSSIKSGVSHGNDIWLQVYKKLRPAADGGAGEDLGEAIFEALSRKPFKVLPILMADTKNTAEELCTFSFESSMPKGGINHYLRRLENSLAAPADGKQRLLASSCKRGIRNTRIAFNSFS